jgi:hypothetical protein
MKAIELLKEQLKYNYKNRPFFFGIEKYNEEKIEKLHEAIEELEEYESDMDKYLDYTTGSRCSKSFNANLSQIKQAHDRWLDDVAQCNKD